MSDWKGVLIERYLSLEREKRALDVALVRDPAISKLKAEIETSKEQVAALERDYNYNIRNYEMKMESIKDEIKENWDIQDKTFKCRVGNVTIKTTKSLIVSNNSGLIQRLTAIFEDATKACDCIRSFNLSKIRKYMDADLIDKGIAHYDPKQSVIIAGATEK
jgi:predicted RNase H-like nuclease (RuvC/YqgF family)